MCNAISEKEELRVTSLQLFEKGSSRDVASFLPVVQDSF